MTTIPREVAGPDVKVGDELKFKVVSVGENDVEVEKADDMEDMHRMMMEKLPSESMREKLPIADRE